MAGPETSENGHNNHQYENPVTILLRRYDATRAEQGVMPALRELRSRLRAATEVHQLGKYAIIYHKIDTELKRIKTNDPLRGDVLCLRDDIRKKEKQYHQDRRAWAIVSAKITLNDAGVRPGS